MHFEVFILISIALNFMLISAADLECSPHMDLFVDVFFEIASKYRIRNWLLNTDGTFHRYDPAF